RESRRGRLPGEVHVQREPALAAAQLAGDRDPRRRPRHDRLGHMRSIANRLRLAFLAMSVLTLAVGVLGLLRMRELNQTMSALATQRFARVQLAQQGVRKVNQNGRGALHLFLVSDRATFDREMARQRATSFEITEIYENFERSLEGEDEKARFGAIIAARAEYVAKRAAAEEALRAGDRSEALARFERDVLPALDEYIH